jgi:hypothetical protein
MHNNGGKGDQGYLELSYKKESSYKDGEDWFEPENLQLVFPCQWVTQMPPFCVPNNERFSFLFCLYTTQRIV